MVKICSLMCSSYVQSNPRIFEDPGTAVHSLGFCTGLLPAAVAAVSRNTEDLHAFGLEIVAISIRLMEAICNRSRQIEAVPGTWAYTVVGAGTEDSKAVLDEFHRAQVFNHPSVGICCDANGPESTQSQSGFHRSKLSHLDHHLWPPIDT